MILKKEFDSFCVKKRNKKKAEVFSKSWLGISYYSFPKGTYLDVLFHCRKLQGIL